MKKHGSIIEYKEGERIGMCTYLRDELVIDRQRRAYFKCMCGNIFVAFIKNLGWSIDKAFNN